jgi:hypothetical protein
MLLNAYGWWQMGQIALIASIAMFVLAGMTVLLSALGLWHFRRVPADEEIPRLATAELLPKTGGTVPVPAFSHS